MSKHTQGPWFSGPKCEISGWVDIFSIEADGGKSLPFAACKHHDQEANARLIAAAPELLEALKLCYEHCRLYHPEVEQNNVGESVRAAIAKAEGANA